MTQRDTVHTHPHGSGVRELVLVRHGESVGNVAAAEAERAGLELIDLETRDADTPLSDLGAEQAAALGTWLGTQAGDDAPDVVWSSPYVRALQTAEIALQEAGSAMDLRQDERLRDRELGILDLLTRTGVAARYPDEDARRHHLGKFYYRPPGGESWADLALRVRSFLGDLDRAEPGRCVLVVAHDAVISSIRYVCEALSEREVLDLARRWPVRNAAVTRLARRPTGWVATVVNDDAHLRHDETPVTEHPGDRDALPH
ncbi:phosphoglycerate mutase [Cellulomonas sp. Root485]|jgi:glucosyl-3-phosphoglycerate phosphatase|uniref:histidine phosphatase family protein n=1 Tax=Cellulomonas sp. Root485 TaxID=1736546 RepID=UPI0006F1EC4D|nr:histidine phosphatase family protein [Cellulomonas sp. Root485]KQY24824.1 phosphoglycerate mutase [Cellulomonas sp. Root485]